MGFRPIDNKRLPDTSFNEPAYLRSPDTGLGSGIGSKLDAALSKLYTWCSANNVPVMAHTSRSFGPTTAYEDRADPFFWTNVLKQDAFPRLRVNLAHFGHFNTPCNMLARKAMSTNVGSGRPEKSSPVRQTLTPTSARLARSSRSVPAGKSSSA
jgi:predicted TIM-barrel fold metal-dependent hydrolase